MYIMEGSLMQLTELLNSVQYVTDSDGQTKGVLLGVNEWRELVALVEQKTVPDHTIALKPEKIATKNVESNSVATREAAMLREEAAFRRLHSSLYKTYAGKYVAIYNEQLIDSDSDQVALYRRTRQQHPNEFVWITPINESPNEVLVFRSPRLLNS